MLSLTTLNFPKFPKIYNVVELPKIYNPGKKYKYSSPRLYFPEDGRWFTAKTLPFPMTFKTYLTDKTYLVYL